MITAQLNDIVNASETFSKIMQQSFKGSLAFKIARLARELEKEMQTFNTERQKIIQKYGEKDENGELKVNEGGSVMFPPDTIGSVNEEFESLLGTELEINAEKLPMSAMDEFNATPQEILSIEKFFEE